MSWGIGRYNTAGLPALVDFAQAKKHFETVVPIRGRKQTVKPAGKNRRFTWYTIEKNMKAIEDGELGKWQESYGIRVYNADLVEFHSTGDITLRTSRWQSPTTMSVLYYSTASFGTVFSVSGKWYFKNKADKSYVFRDELQLHKVDGVYEPVNIQQEYKHKANRKVMNQLTKKYKQFTDYATQMLAIEPRVTRLEVAEFAQGLNFQSPNVLPNRWSGDEKSGQSRRNVLMGIEKFIATQELGLAYELATYLSFCFGGWDYRAQVSVCTPEQFTRGFKEVLKYSFRDEVFIKEAQEVGVPFHDSNKKYFYFK